MLLPPRFFLLAGIFLLTALSYLAQARAELSNLNLTWTPPALSATIKDEGATAAGFVRRVYVSCGTNQIAFNLPAGFELGTADPHKVVLVSSDYKYSISINLAGPVTAANPATRVAGYRHELQTQYAGAQISEEFARNVANHDGTAFDLTWRNAAGTAQAIRTAYVPTRTGVVQFTLLTTVEQFGPGARFFDALLMTVQSNEAGKIEPAIVAGCG